MAIEKIAIGGLFRCCIDTINDMSDDELNSFSDGDVISCKHEAENNNRMIVEGNTIKWNKPK